MADSSTGSQAEQNHGIIAAGDEDSKNTLIEGLENSLISKQSKVENADAETKLVDGDEDLAEEHNGAAEEYSRAAGEHSKAAEEHSKTAEEQKAETVEQKIESEGSKAEAEEQKDEADKNMESSANEKGSTPKAQRTPPAERKREKKEELSDEQRKSKIEELRKKKITDYRKKEDEKRKAVLERKKKLEEAERVKQEALLKKISGASSTAPKRPASAPARRAVSFSSLAHLKKTHAVAQEIDIGEKKPLRHKEAEDKVGQGDQDRRKTLPGRPRSAMERKRYSSFSSDKTKPVVQKNGIDGSIKAAPAARPRSSMGTRTEPKIRQSLTNLPHRPPSAASNRQGTKPEESRQKPPANRTRAMPTLPGKPLVPPNKEKEMKKAKSASSVLQQGSQEKSKGPVQPERKSTVGDGKQKAKSDDARPPTAKPRRDSTEKQRASMGKEKDPGKRDASKPGRRRSHEGSPSTKAEGPKKGVVTNEADAKRLLAEKRRQVKEEAERKALEEQNRLEEERIKREEEQKIRAEELRKEEERQKAHLEELQKEAEERERLAQEEKLRKEMEERERLEAEKRQRQEEIDRKAQEEVDRRAKEREQKRQQEEADRLERKKRVQEILGSRIRGSPVSERPVSPTPFMSASLEETPQENSPPAIDSAASARNRVQMLLEKNQRKSEESSNGSEDGDKAEIVKPQLSPVQPSGESHRDETRDVALEANGQTIMNENKFEPESSLTEADKQAMEDAEKIDGENLIESNNLSQINGVENKSSENSSIPQTAESRESTATIEEKTLWNEAEKLMAEKQENLLNSLDKNTSHKVEQTQSSEENRLWQLVEGQLELEECF